MVAKYEVKRTVATELSSEKAASEVKVADEKTNTNVLEHYQSSIKAENLELQIRTLAMDGTVKEKNELLNNFNGKVWAQITDLD